MGSMRPNILFSAVVLEHDPWVGATLKKQATAERIVAVNVQYHCGPDLANAHKHGILLTILQAKPLKLV